jgi:hypothetical protein
MERYATPYYLSLGLFTVAAAASVARGRPHSILAGLAIALMVFGALPRNPTLAFLMGALAMLYLQPYRGAVTWEGFADVSGSVAEESAEPDEEKKEEEAAVVKTDPTVDAAEKKAAEKFSGGKKPLLPDNATRREPLELGKPYKLPSENDDKGYHLDAGTTFLNAYKALKPDQIAAMTRDTQELLATQKSLVGMLESFGPLMKDMKSITGIFGSSN